MKGLLKTQLLVMVALIVPNLVSAGVFDGFGAGTNSLGGRCAVVDRSAYASYNNPAGLEDESEYDVELLYLDFTSSLELDGVKAQTDDIQGYALGCGVRLSPRIGAGMAFYAPEGFALKTQIRSPASKRWVLYNDRFSSFQLAAGLGVRVTDRINLGVGLRFMAGLSMGIPMSIYISNYQNPQENDPNFHYSYVEGKAEIKGDYALILGARWNLTPNSLLAVVYRDEVSIPLKGQAQVEVEIGSIYHLDIPMTLTGNFLFEPRQVALGGRHTFRTRWTTELEITWSQWSNFKDSRLIAEVGAMDSNPPYFEDYPNPDFHDTFSFKTNLICSFSPQFDCTLGYRYEPSPAPNPADKINLVDADQEVVSALISVQPRLPCNSNSNQLKFHVFGQIHLHHNQTITKTDHETYGPDYPVTGYLTIFGFGLSFYR